MTEMVTSGSMSGGEKRSDGLLGESGYERRRSQQAPPVLYATARVPDSTSGFMRLGRERLLSRSGLGWGDPDFPRKRSGLRRAGGEALRVRGVGRGEHSCARGEALRGPAVVDVGRRQQPKADVMMLGVVPGEEDMAVSPCVLDRAEARRERRAVLERLELRF